MFMQFFLLNFQCDENLASSYHVSDESLESEVLLYGWILGAGVAQQQQQHPLRFPQRRIQ